MHLVPIDELNQLPEAEFVDSLKPLFEAAEPLAQALHAARPFETYSQLIEVAESLTARMSFEDQSRVLAAHPRIGENPANLSAMSYREQGYTGASPAEHGVDARLAELNAAYEQKFGFRFVVFVNKRPRAEIVKVLEGRLYNDRGAELATGRREMFLIARDRLCSLS